MRSSAALADPVAPDILERLDGQRCWCPSSPPRTRSRCRPFRATIQVLVRAGSCSRRAADGSAGAAWMSPFTSRRVDEPLQQILAGAVDTLALTLAHIDAARPKVEHRAGGPSSVRSATSNARLHHGAHHDHPPCCLPHEWLAARRQLWKREGPLLGPAMS